MRSFLSDTFQLFKTKFYCCCNYYDYRTLFFFYYFEPAAKKTYIKSILLNRLRMLSRYIYKCDYLTQCLKSQKCTVYKCAEHFCTTGVFPFQSAYVYSREPYFSLFLSHSVHFILLVGFTPATFFSRSFLLHRHIQTHIEIDDETNSNNNNVFSEFMINSHKTFDETGFLNSYKWSQKSVENWLKWWSGFVSVNSFI